MQFSTLIVGLEILKNISENSKTETVLIDSVENNRNFTGAEPLDTLWIRAHTHFCALRGGNECAMDHIRVLFRAICHRWQQKKDEIEKQKAILVSKYFFLYFEQSKKFGTIFNNHNLAIRFY